MRKKRGKPDRDFASAVGQEISRLRREYGYTLADMADESGVPISTWQQWEQRGPRLCWLPLIAKALDVEPCELVELAVC